MDLGFGFVMLLRAVSKDKKTTAAIVLIGLALLSLVAGLFGQFIILMLIIAELVLAFFIGEFELKKIGIELVTLIVVLAGMLYGPIVGLILGIVLLTFRFILTRGLGPYIVYCIPTMGAVGLIAGYAAIGNWFGGDVAIIGISLSLLYNLITGGLGCLTMQDFFEELVWSGSNFALNFILFTYVAPIILLAMM